MSEKLLGSSEAEARKTLGMLIDLLVIVENDSLDDPDNSPEVVELYNRLFGTMND